MASQCTCGAGGGSGGSTQQKKLQKRKSTKKGERENPYSDRGVEKFSALLAELEEKKRTIYSKFSPEEVSMIRFVHDGDDKLKPVVVRAKSSKLGSKTSKTMEVEEEKDLEQEMEKKMEIVESSSEDESKKMTTTKRLSMEAVISGVKANQAWMSNYGVRVGAVLVLVLLVAIFGRWWKKYYLLQLQATVCPRIEAE